MLCSACENIPIPTVNRTHNGHSHSVPLFKFSSLRKLRDSARTCDLCNLFHTTLESLKLNGIKNDKIRLSTWASDAQGDPVGISRAFIHVGNRAGRWIDVYANPNSVAANVGFAVGTNLSQDSSSPASFEKYRKWLSDCLASHDSCPSDEKVELPSRVLQIATDEGTQCLRLVTTNGQTGRYAALSHCWGSHGGLTTSKASITNHMNGIDPHAVSKTLRDAIEITRRMGLQYLWVDTLCIIQDDEQDWTAEAAQMDRVYKLARFTIAASGAKDGNGGCFFERDHTSSSVVVPHLFPRSRTKTQLTFKTHVGSISESFVDSPLNQRAWCLQESILSSRMLHFGRNRVIWQCRERLSADDYGDLRRSKVSASQDRRMIEPHLNFSLAMDIDSWFNIVEEYSRRHLSRPADKLFAIEGIKKLFAPSFGSPYFAGIWLSNFHQGLLWYSVTGGMKSPPSYRAGSWSWLALDGAVEHLHTRYSGSYTSQDILSVIDLADNSPGSYSTLEGSICVSSIVLKVSRSDMTLSIPEFTAVSSEAHRNLLTDKPQLQCHALLDDSGEAIGWAAFDQPSFVNESVSCIVVSELKKGDNFQSYHVLVLGHTESSPTAFRRLGVGEIIESETLENDDHAEITIV